MNGRIEKRGEDVKGQIEKRGKGCKEKDGADGPVVTCIVCDVEIDTEKPHVTVNQHTERHVPGPPGAWIGTIHVESSESLLWLCGSDECVGEVHRLLLPLLAKAGHPLAES